MIKAFNPCNTYSTSKFWSSHQTPNLTFFAKFKHSNMVCLINKYHLFVQNFYKHSTKLQQKLTTFPPLASAYRRNNRQLILILQNHRLGRVLLIQGQHHWAVNFLQIRELGHQLAQAVCGGAAVRQSESDLGQPGQVSGPREEQDLDLDQRVEILGGFDGFICNNFEENGLKIETFWFVYNGIGGFGWNPRERWENWNLGRVGL